MWNMQKQNRNRSPEPRIRSANNLSTMPNICNAIVSATTVRHCHCTLHSFINAKWKAENERMRKIEFGFVHKIRFAYTACHSLELWEHETWCDKHDCATVIAYAFAIWQRRHLFVDLNSHIVRTHRLEYGLHKIYLCCILSGMNGVNGWITASHAIAQHECVNDMRTHIIKYGQHGKLFSCIFTKILATDK